MTIILQNIYHVTDSELGPGRTLPITGTIGGTISSGGVWSASSYGDGTAAVPITGADVGPPAGAITTSTYPTATGHADFNIVNSSANPVVGQGTTTITVGANGNFSLYSQIIVTFGSGGGQFSANLEQLAGVVPEPSTFAIAGIGALGFIAYGLRRRKARGA